VEGTIFSTSKESDFVRVGRRRRRRRLAEKPPLL
jgi:hypothetical protein